MRLSTVASVGERDPRLRQMDDANVVDHGRQAPCLVHHRNLVFQSDGDTHVPLVVDEEPAEFAQPWRRLDVLDDAQGFPRRGDVAAADGAEFLVGKAYYHRCSAKLQVLADSLNPVMTYEATEVLSGGVVAGHQAEGAHLAQSQSPVILEGGEDARVRGIADLLTGDRGVEVDLATLAGVVQG